MLHFPTWRGHYQRYLEAQKAGAVERPYPQSRLYARIAALREASPPLVYRKMRVVEQASATFARLPDGYVLAERGAELLCQHRGYELDELWYERPRKRALKNFEHSVAIGTFYAALRCALEYHGRQLADWQGDHVLAGRDPQIGGVRYDRVRVVGVREEVAVLLAIGGLQLREKSEVDSL